MKKIIVLKCKCGRIRRFGEWVFLNTKQKDDITEELHIEEVKELSIIQDICTFCAKKMNQ